MKNQNTSTVFIAIILIIFGGLALLSTLGHLQFNIQEYFSIALIPIIIGIQMLINRNFPSGIALIFVGLIIYIPKLLTPEQVDIFHKIKIPLILILLGAYFLFKELFNTQKHLLPINQGISEADYIEENNIFSGSSKNYATQSFRGGKINCIMGGSELDLSSAKMISPAELQVSCIMGGIELKIPRDWNVQAKISPILGGIEDKGGNSIIDPNKILTITGTIVMGGVEIKRY